ncbi:MAG TPA: hypothetical protein PK867_22005 [Pirellulales bacterium]|nr:hypothetical protein [Pirellulales bacterium]
MEKCGPRFVDEVAPSLAADAARIKQVRRAYRYFMADYQAFCRYVVLAADGCGGHNTFTEREYEFLR